MIPWACRRRKVDQRKSPFGRPRGRRGKYLLTVRGDTRIPSFNINSLAMRSSPHEGFSSAIWRISTCSSTGIGGRPGRDFNRQNSFHPARCKRISVSGRTTVSASRQSKSCDSRVRRCAWLNQCVGALRRAQGRAQAVNARTGSRLGSARSKGEPQPPQRFSHQSHQNLRDPRHLPIMPHCSRMSSKGGWLGHGTIYLRTTAAIGNPIRARGE